MEIVPAMKRPFAFARMTLCLGLLACAGAACSHADSKVDSQADNPSKAASAAGESLDPVVQVPATSQGKVPVKVAQAPEPASANPTPSQDTDEAAVIAEASQHGREWNQWLGSYVRNNVPEGTNIP